MAQVAAAQLTLSGTSYNQNFDNLGSGLPVGWTVRTAASATQLGTDVSGTNFVSTIGATTSWSSTGGNFRNAASADGFTYYASGTTTLQDAAADRALAVRQVGNGSSTFPGSDSGAAFVLQIANTTSLTNFNLTFKLQSLDSTSSRSTIWKVDYAFGATPTSFTLASPTGTMITGGNTYSNNTITVNFGSVLDNQAGPVWLRIVTLNGTTGSGSRTTTGVDDFNLTWTGGAAGSFKPVVTSLTPANNATNVSVSTNSLAVTFDRNITAGAGQIVLRNETDQTNVAVVAANGPNVAISGKTATITGFSSLLAGKTYHVRIDSTCFDTAGYRFNGIYDSTSWRFSTVPASTTVTQLDEKFDAACAAGPIPAGWSRQSVTGNQQWNCYTVASSGNVVYRMNGFQSGNNVNEDWLVTPRMDLSAPNTNGFRFSMWKRFSGTEPQVLVSTNFAGDVTTANWTALSSFVTGPADTNAWKQHNISITPFKATPFFIAFKYTSTASDGYDLRIDSVMTMTTTGVFNLNDDNKMPVSVIGKATGDQINVAFHLGASAMVTASIYDLNGREVYRNRVNGKAGDNRISLTPGNLRSGMYLVRLTDGTTRGAAKAIVE